MTDLDIGSGIKLIHKLAKSMTKTSSKIHKPIIYDKIIHDLIYMYR